MKCSKLLHLVDEVTQLIPIKHVQIGESMLAWRARAGWLYNSVCLAWPLGVVVGVHLSVIVSPMVGSLCQAHTSVPAISSHCPTVASNVSPLQCHLCMLLGVAQGVVYKLRGAWSISWIMALASSL